MQPPLLFVHGTFGQASNFEPWLGYFRDAGYACSAISLPGHEPPDSDLLKRLTLNDYLAAVSNAIRQADRPPVVIGHSLGGLLALMVAAGTECAGLVLVGAPAPGQLPAQIGVLRYALTFVPRIAAGLPISAPPEAVRSLVTHDLSAAESEEIIAQGTLESGRVLRRLFFGVSRSVFGGIKCPVLCLGGGADRLVPLSAAESIATATGGDLVVFPGHGHWLIAGSLTDVVAASVKAWLQRNF